MKSISAIQKAIRVTNAKFTLSDFSTRMSSKAFDDENALKDGLEKDVSEISKLQVKLYAENNQSLLIILQGMDSAGKDGTIKHLLKGVNPQGVVVASFKHPSAQELEYDYLWRHTLQLPKHGQIVIFNRSHYENVLISKVHPEFVLAERIKAYNTLPKINAAFWKERYEQIKHFDARNIETGTHVLKFFLHLSKEEQGHRFLARINEPDKHWKFSSKDIEERSYWSSYQDAYEQAIRNTSTQIAPWYVIPADDKLQAHVLIGRIVLEKLQEMNPTLPPKTEQELAYMKRAKEDLEREVKQQP